MRHRNGAPRHPRSRFSEPSRLRSLQAYSIHRQQGPNGGRHRSCRRRAAPDGGVGACRPVRWNGVVSARLAQVRPVFAADIQEFSCVLTTALLQGGSWTSISVDDVVALAAADTRKSPLANLMAFEDMVLADDGDNSLLEAIIELGSMAVPGNTQRLPSPLRELVTAAFNALHPGPATALTRYYGGPYFSYRQASDLDAIASAVRELPDGVRISAIAAVLSVASEIVSTVGNQFAQPARLRASDGSIKVEAARSVRRSRSLRVPDLFRAWLVRYACLTPAANSWRVRRLDFRDVLWRLPPEVRVVYADPPYTRDHYSRFYHVLETIAIGDEPGASTRAARGGAVTARGVYRRREASVAVLNRVAGASGLRDSHALRCGGRTGISSSRTRR